ncbi:hypothetical protein [Candidatus Accumulibacter sp. ACC003]|uniref:hypothetical protein n=1 Tax=Candidatus Accumulibacter sp. ACC003 TaxID=2823334 RepID=UPI0025BBB667|nr:hypothetical protein [Candidatus Accumulibacter sp. ACC003]
MFPAAGAQHNCRENQAPEANSRLLLEHRNLGKLLGLLDRFTGNRKHPTLAEIELLAGVFFYVKVAYATQESPFTPLREKGRG